MANAWGGSFGSAWGVSWGQASAVAVVAGPSHIETGGGGGGFSRHRRSTYRKRDAEVVNLVPIILDLIRRR